MPCTLSRFALLLLLLFAAVNSQESNYLSHHASSSPADASFNFATRTFSSDQNRNQLEPVSAINPHLNAGVYGFTGNKNHQIAADTAVSRHQEMQNQQNNGRFSSPVPGNADARRFNGAPQAQQPAAAQRMDAQNSNARMTPPQYNYAPQPQQYQQQPPQYNYAPQPQQYQQQSQYNYMQQQPQQFHQQPQYNAPQFAAPQPQPQQYQQQPFAAQNQQRQGASLMSQLYGTQAAANPSQQSSQYKMKESAIISDTDATSFLDKLFSGYYLHDQGPPTSGAPALRDEIMHVVTFGGSTFGIVASVIVALVVGALIVWTSYTLLLCLKPRVNLNDEESRGKALPLAKQMLLDQEQDIYQKI